VQDPGLAPFEYASSFDAGGRTWRLTFSPTPASIASLETWQPLGTLAGGLCLTAVAVFYVQILRRRTWRIEELARDRSREIDRRIEAERERRRLDAKLQQAQRLESLGVLAGGIAHDFNNLLTTILGNADLLAMQPRDNQRGDEAAQIRLAALRAAELTQQMLAYSGRGSFTTSPVDLSEVVQEIVQLLASSVSKKAELRCALAPDLPMIAADGSQIRQVVMNLVTNASEALGSEPGVVDVSTGFRWFEAEELQDAFGGETVEPGEKVYLEVSDTGCGMDARALERLFDPFFTTKREGRGLGLAAALGIVRSHSGSIHCTSRVGEGTRFRVLFPGSDLEKPKREEAPSTLGWQGGRTILVVDDDGPVRALATRLLEGLGFHVRSANDGAAGVEAFRRFADEIDVVLLDMTMPVMGGGEALAAIRSIRADARIVVSSGYDKQGSLANLGTGRPDAFLQKPFTRDALAKALRNALPEGAPTEAGPQ